MQEIIPAVEQNQAALVEGNLFRWLADEQVPGHERLSFAPAMLYYLMGFKDVLAALHMPIVHDDLDRHADMFECWYQH